MTADRIQQGRFGAIDARLNTVKGLPPTSIIQKGVAHMQRKKSAHRYAVNLITVKDGAPVIETVRFIHLNGTNEANEKAVRKFLNAGEFFDDLGMVEKLLYIPTEFFDDLAVEIDPESTERERAEVWEHEALERLERLTARLKAHKTANE